MVRRKLEDGCVPALLLDPRGRIRGANRAACEFLGVDEAQIIDKRALGLVFARDRRGAMRRFAQCVAQGVCPTKGLRVEARGRTHNLLVHLQPVAEGWELTFEDVTEICSAEQDLKQARRHLAKIERLASLGSFGSSISAQDQAKFSPQMKMIFGFDPDADITMSELMSRVHPDDLERVRNAMVKARETMTGFTHDHRVLWPDGTVKWVRCSIDFEDGGQTTTGVTIDFTELLSAQAKLREGEQWQRAILDSAHDGIISVDTAGIVRGFSKQVEGLLGFQASEVVGKKLFDTLIPPERRDLHLATFKRQRADMALATRLEATLLHASGRRVTTEISIGASMVSGEHIMHAFVRDLTEKRRLQSDLGQAQKLEAMGIVAGSVAHDFNNMLAAISTFATLALEAIPEGGDREDLEQVLKATERATRLTRQLLAFTRKQSFETKAIDIDAHISDLIPMMQQLAGDRVELVVVPRAGGIRVIVDVTQLELMLVNLVVNARDAMPTGGTLTIETAGPDIENGQSTRVARISVRDTGLGIPEDALPKIFDAFYTTKSEGTGTGLGLATVHGIVKQNRGRLSVRSTVGVGTAFDVMLPIDPTSEEEAVPSRRSLPPAALTCAGTVLLVEDDEAVRKACHRALDAAGFKVLSVQNAGEALILAEEKTPFDLLLTDVALARVSGLQLAERVQKLRPDARILFVSGLSDSDERLRAVRTANMPFLAKPFTVPTLVAKVSETLGVAIAC